MFVLVDNLKINYEESGQGNALLLLHGWKNDLTIWNEITLLLNNYRIIRLDLPGFGKSDLPPQSWNISNYAEFLNKFLEKLNVSKTILMGHSFGGRIVIKFGVLYPDKISKLVLVDSGGIRLKSFRRFFIFILAKLGKIFWLFPLLRLKKDEWRKKFYEAIKVGDYLEPSQILKKTFLKIIAEDLRNEAKKINLPTLIVWGEKDLITPLNEGYLLASSIKTSRLIPIKDASHWPFIDKKEDFIKILTNFL